jgi:hypothetical protein
MRPILCPLATLISQNVLQSYLPSFWFQVQEALSCQSLHTCYSSSGTFPAKWLPWPLPMAYGPNPSHCLFLEIKFYWHTATLFMHSLWWTSFTLCGVATETVWPAKTEYSPSDLPARTCFTYLDAKSTSSGKPFFSSEVRVTFFSSQTFVNTTFLIACLTTQ